MDEQARKIERAAAQGDPSRQALLVARLRSGTLSEEKLRLAACSGDDDARTIAGVVCTRPRLPGPLLHLWHDVLYTLDQSGHLMTKQTTGVEDEEGGCDIWHRAEEPADCPSVPPLMMCLACSRSSLDAYLARVLRPALSLPTLGMVAVLAVAELVTPVVAGRYHIPCATCDGDGGACPACEGDGSRPDARPEGVLAAARLCFTGPLPSFESLLALALHTREFVEYPEDAYEIPNDVVAWTLLASYCAAAYYPDQARAQIGGAHDPASLVEQTIQAFAEIMSSFHIRSHPGQRFDSADRPILDALLPAVQAWALS